MRELFDDIDGEEQRFRFQGIDVLPKDEEEEKDGESEQRGKEAGCVEDP